MSTIKEELLNEKPVLIDGPLGTQLSAKAQSHPLWSTFSLVEEPETILKIHEDYIKLGSQVIITATYQTATELLAEYYDPKEINYDSVIVRAISLAKKATKITDHKVYVAGSIGPYGASLHDGSEYTGDYGFKVPYETLYEYHERRIQLFEQEKVDILAIETIPSFLECQVLIDLVTKYHQIPFWFSLSCADGEHLADGTDLAEVVKLFKKSSKVVIDNCLAIGANCGDSKKTLEVLETIKKNDSLKLNKIIYPNCGEYTNSESWKRSGEYDWDEFVKKCSLDPSIKFIGSCCGGTFDDITSIKNAINKQYY